MVHLRFQLTKQLDLVSQLTRGMHNLKSRPEFSSRCVISLGGEFGHFAQPNCRNKQENEPRAATDVSGGATPKKPRNARYPQNNQCNNPPSMIRRAGTQRPSQHQERRDYGDEEKNVIQIHRSKLQRPHGIG